MTKIDFNSKAATYEELGLVQKLTSDILLNLASVNDGEDVLDLGCGPGGVTRKITEMTGGSVVGVDVSVGMINEASTRHQDIPNLSFYVKDACDLGFSDCFDVIYCNSAFQWFQNPELVVRECYAALKNGGRMAMQAPATANYCPAFLTAINKVSSDPATGGVFKTWKNPWVFMNSAEDYARLFEGAGFKVVYSQLHPEFNYFSAEQVYGVFQSGAENGYLNQEFYSAPLTEEYISNFRRLVREAIKEQADANSMVMLEFTRIYLVAEK
ncbi:MAG: class I SAM-dependent methyltransferase [Candidatus Saccharibacteria bacterium]